MEQQGTFDSSQVASPNLGSLRPIVAQPTSRYDVVKHIWRSSCIIEPGQFLSTLPTYLPPQWSDSIHPEGRVYFHRNSGVRVVTESYLNPVTANPLASHGIAIPEPQDGNLDADDNPSPRNVHMFSNAQNISIRDTNVNNVGGDMTIIHNHNTYCDPEPSPLNDLSQWSNLFSSAKSHIFHAVEIIKSVLPSGFVTTPEILLDAKVAEDALKYPPLICSNAKILLSKTSLCIPGFVAQMMTSVRYSFFS